MICINESWGIEADQCNWILKKLTKSEKNGELWKTVGFYPTLEQLLHSYTDKRTKSIASKDIHLDGVLACLQGLQDVIAKEIRALGNFSKTVCMEKEESDFFD